MIQNVFSKLCVELNWLDNELNLTFWCFNHTIWEVYWLNPFAARWTSGGRTRKENEKLFWDLTGSPAGNYVREASGGNWAKCMNWKKSINKTDPLCIICSVCVLSEHEKIYQIPTWCHVKGQKKCSFVFISEV